MSCFYSGKLFGTACLEDDNENAQAKDEKTRRSRALELSAVCRSRSFGSRRFRRLGSPDIFWDVKGVAVRVKG
jgi:hypothetical protein